MIIVVRVGCLECGDPTDLLGIYPTIQIARTQHPDLHTRNEYDDGQQSAHRLNWRGGDGPLTIAFAYDTSPQRGGGNRSLSRPAMRDDRPDLHPPLAQAQWYVGT